jgi:aspartate carbamoyltransferase catalytic subunit
MKHFLEISQLSHEDITALLQRAMYFKQYHNYPRYPQHSLATLFYEHSTRTRISFERAAHHLAMPCVSVDLAHSSEQKGETMQDTLRTLCAMGVRLFVVRHSQSFVPQILADAFDDRAQIINAGDGTHAHPSQALLDMMTILEHKSDLKSLKIAIVGDLRHSRVSHSLQCICAILGVGELVLVAPDIWQPEIVHYGTSTTSLSVGLKDADVVIALRVQQERLQATEQLNLADYRRDYAITSNTMAKAKPDAILMHPGPVNRGVELDSDVADGSQSVILQQVSNGVFMRMAILDALISVI